MFSHLWPFFRPCFAGLVDFRFCCFVVVVVAVVIVVYLRDDSPLQKEQATQSFSVNSQ